MVYFTLYYVKRANFTSTVSKRYTTIVSRWSQNHETPNCQLLYDVIMPNEAHHFRLCIAYWLSVDDCIQCAHCVVYRNHLIFIKFEASFCVMLKLKNMLDFLQSTKCLAWTLYIVESTRRKTSWSMDIMEFQKNRQLFQICMSTEDGSTFAAPTETDKVSFRFSNTNRHVA
jgi:hypothetical protein